MDTMRGFRAPVGGRIHNAIAIYCTECVADMSMAEVDIPGLTPETVIESWNRRATPTEPVVPSSWISVDERYPEGETDCLVWVDKGEGSKWPPHPYLTRWSMQREDPTGMGGPTMEMGYGWDDFYEQEVTHWMNPPEPPHGNR